MGSDARLAPFEQAYPHIARSVRSHACIELGQDNWSHSFARALDVGGTVREGDTGSHSVDEALYQSGLILAYDGSREGDLGWQDMGERSW